MKRRVLAAALAGLTFACNGTQVDLMDMSCGTVVGKLHGNAELLLFEELARRQEVKKDPFKVYPQVVVRKSAVWPPGSTLRVRFLDGEAADRAFVMEVGSEWLEGLNLRFAESTDTEAEIRITFTGRGVWSKVGLAARSVGYGAPTMGLAGLLQSTETSLRRAYVLHEFGHALGALHEHQRLKAKLTWETKAVYDHYLQLYGWSSTQVDKEVILPLEYTDMVESPDFDPNSVMMYPILKTFTKEQFVQGWNPRLTAWDRQVMASLYR